VNFIDNIFSILENRTYDVPASIRSSVSARMVL